MADENEKWAVNVAFVAKNERVAKKILKYLEEQEDAGEIEDSTGIDGPYDSLQLMLKRRSENLALDAKTSSSTGEDDEIE